jgi:hypothetical protein
MLILFKLTNGGKQSKLYFKKSVVTGGTVVQCATHNPKITGLNLPSGSEREKNVNFKTLKN